MKKTNTVKPALLAVLALGLTVPVFAQSAPNTENAPANTAAIDPGPGLVGINYSELSFGYQRNDGAPKDLRDYEFVSNENFLKEGPLGLDANFTYDYLAGAANGFSDRRNEAQVGATGFLMEAWGKPFVTADGGFAWQDAGGVSRKGFAYTLTGGVEFQVLKNLALTPFIEYQAEPSLYNHGLPLTDYPDHVLDYGIKATYRITHQWSASLSADLDQYNRNDFGLRGGVSYRF
jgi:opacity protein-like surface antigen